MATIPTPEQGKPILDFSAGTFDGSSNLIQSRNGATEHVSGDDVADYVNTSRIYNTLETESKTPVGAINEVNGKDASDIPYDNTESGLTATDVQAVIDELYEKTRYKIGDEVFISGIVTTGYITSSSKSLRFYIPLNKPFNQVGVRNINLANITAAIRMIDGSYILNNARLSTLSNSIRVYSNGLGLYIMAAVDVSTDHNNTPCAVQIMEYEQNIITLA
jgi:hypothetical protein